MKVLCFIIFLQIMNIGDAINIFTFDKDSDLSNWYIVDDVVMGGRSDGHFEINKEGHGLFYGDVSLDNYGGFSSVRYRFKKVEVTGKKHCKIRLKGDGKRYQFRVKENRNHRHSYIQYFETTGDWEVIELPLETMYPTFRGMKLDMANYAAITMEELSILISNKKAESFQLEIDWIVLE